MHLGSVYIIVRDFAASLTFYEKLLGQKVTARNGDRFACFDFEGHGIALLNGFFDEQNPGKTLHDGQYDPAFDDYAALARAQNTRKLVWNFWTEDLAKERERIAALGITNTLTPIKYLCNASPYYYFQLLDPDGNVIEVTGEYKPIPGDGLTHGGERPKG